MWRRYDLEIAMVEPKPGLKSHTVWMAALQTSVLLGSAMLYAQAPTSPEPEESKILDLIAIMNTEVIVASKKPQTITESPAILTVLTASDIHTSGFRSVGEALATVPGFYDVYDELNHNLGMRGINGGMRAYSSILKVMIDGQPISFRSDGTNFLGPELIAMEAVERIEVIRGPASAVYGANAFLGVVNIVTRDAVRATSLMAYGEGRAGRRGMGLDGNLSYGQKDWGVLLAGTAAKLNRSGMLLPQESPIMRIRPPASLESSEDFSRPRSLYAKARYQVGENIEFKGMAHYSRLDNNGEWLDFGTLSHQNRVSVINHFFRIQAKYRPLENLEFEGSLAESHGGPNSREKLSSGSSTSYPMRQISYQGQDASLDIRYSPWEAHDLSLGFDRSMEDHQLLSIYTVNSATGLIVPVSVQPRKAFTSTGISFQYSGKPTKSLGLTANVRNDHQNIYGDNTSLRLGLVYAFTSEWNGKLLYGSSFKAPSPYQLYAVPLYSGEVVGNPALKPMTARTLEAELNWLLSIHLTASLNAFHNKVSDKIELLPSGVNWVPMNFGDQESDGFEGALNWVTGIHTWTAATSYQKTKNHTPDVFRGDLVTPSVAYPSWIGSFRYVGHYARWGTLEAGYRFISRRRATDSNIYQNFYTPYSMGGYGTCHLCWTLNLGWRHYLSFRAVNLGNAHYAEPGYRGYDIPGKDRTFQLSYRWSY